MKLSAFLPTVLATTALAGMFTFHNASQGFQLQLSQASAEEIIAEAGLPPGLTAQQMIDNLTAHKGQFGSGDELRRYFFGDLEPVGIQPGGAGMVVNLYNSTNNITVAYCSTYDVVVAVSSGRVAEFPADAVR
jgi:hypothetical protein